MFVKWSICLLIVVLATVAAEKKANQFDEAKWKQFIYLEEDLGRAISKMPDDNVDEETLLNALVPKREWLSRFFTPEVLLEMWRHLYEATKEEEPLDKLCGDKVMQSFGYALEAAEVDLARQRPVTVLAQYLKPHLETIFNRCPEHLDQRAEQKAKEFSGQVSEEDSDVVYFKSYPDELGLHFGLLTDGRVKRNTDGPLNSLIDLAEERQKEKLMNEVYLRPFLYFNLLQPCQKILSSLESIVRDSKMLVRFHPGKAEQFVAERTPLYRTNLLRYQLCENILAKGQESNYYIKRKVLENKNAHYKKTSVAEQSSNEVS